MHAAAASPFASLPVCVLTTPRGCVAGVAQLSTAAVHSYQLYVCAVVTAFLHLATLLWCLHTHQGSRCPAAHAALSG